MPTKKGEKSDPESLEAKAQRIIARKYKLKDVLVVDTASDMLRSAQTPVYRFRAVSTTDANGPKYDVVLDSTGAELDLDDMSKRDEASYFSVPVAPMAPGVAGALVSAVTINPRENKLELKQGDTFTETITVTIPPKAGVVRADVYFLADTTCSMADILNAVKAGVGNILAALSGLGLDFAYGVGNYKDFPRPPYAFQHQLNPTNVAADVTAAISTWNASASSDHPEGQLFALHKLAEAPGGPIGWRAGSRRIIVWFGDAPGHDPICATISGEPADITEASVTAKLVAETITMLAISTSKPGLDADPKVGASDYMPACGAPGGSSKQGTRIANATGGTFMSGINPGNIVQTIIDLVKRPVTGIGNVKLVPAGGVTPFVTSISPASGYGPPAGDTEHKLTFEVIFTGAVPCKDTAQVFTGTLDVVADRTVVAQKLVEVTVPACKGESLFSYSVKFVCGTQADCACTCAPVRPGIYATEINIHNLTEHEVPIRKLVVPVVLAGAAAGREPGSVGPKAADKLVLPAHSATMDDCRRLAELLLGAAPTGQLPITIGFLQIISPVELSVTAVYTATGLNGGAVSLDVKQINPRRI